MSPRRVLNNLSSFGEADVYLARSRVNIVRPGRELATGTSVTRSGPINWGNPKDRRSWPAPLSALVEAAGIEPASESLRQRRLHAYPGCGGNPRPEAPFPVSAPRRINPANRAVGPIPESHRRLGRTAGQARLVDVLSRPAGVVRKDVA